MAFPFNSDDFIIYLFYFVIFFLNFIVHFIIFFKF